MWLPFDIARFPMLHPSRRTVAVLGLLLVATMAAGVVTVSRQAARPVPPSLAAATLTVNSTPTGATIIIDDREHGTTPLTLSVTPGPHRVTLRAPGFLDSPVRVVQTTAGETVAVQATLWSATPQVVPLRPPGVGQTIADARFVAGDRLALTITPARRPEEREVWLRAADGRLERAEPPRPAPLVAVAPDGVQVAYAIAGQAATARPPAGTSGQPRLDELWITGLAGDAGARRLSLADEPMLKGATLTDILWAPDGRHLLATALDRRPDGSPFTSLLWLASTGGPVQHLPSIAGEVVAASLAWSPAGDRVAFLAEARAGGPGVLVVLTPAVPTAVEQLRNLADVPALAANRLPASTLAWSPDGRFVLFPSSPTVGGGFLGLGGGGRTGFAQHDLGLGAPVPLPGVTGQGAVWRDERTLLTLTPGRDGQVALSQTTLGARTPDSRASSPLTVTTRTLTAVPLRPGGHPIGARWDLPHRRLLLVLPGRAGGHDDLDWWLIQW